MDFHASGTLARGVLGNVKASSKAGRYLLDKEREVLALLSDPTPVQRLLVTDYCRRAWEMEQLFPLIAAGNADFLTLQRYGVLRKEQLAAQQLLFPTTRTPQPPCCAGPESRASCCAFLG